MKFFVTSVAAFFCFFKINFSRQQIAFVCHGAYWPELLISIVFRRRYSLIVQGSEVFINRGLRGLINRIILRN